MTTRNCDLLSSLGALWELLRELIKSAHTYAHKNTQSIRQLKDLLACLNTINMEIQSLMTYCQRLFALKGEKCFLFQAHENKLLHLSLMGKQELCLQCIFNP